MYNPSAECLKLQTIENFIFNCCIYMYLKKFNTPYPNYSFTFKINTSFYFINSEATLLRLQNQLDIKSKALINKITLPSFSILLRNQKYKHYFSRFQGNITLSNTTQSTSPLNPLLKAECQYWSPATRKLIFVA